MISLENTIITAQIEEPKSPAGSYDLPCGWVAPDGSLYTDIEVKEITGYEEDILASKSIPSQKKLSSLLASCTTRIGNVTDKAALREIIQDLPVGDRVFLLFAIRRVSLGDIFPFEEKCPECEMVHLYQVNFEDLAINKMPEAGKRIYDVTAPSGKAVRFKVMTGRDEEKLSKINRNGLDTVSLGMLARIELIDSKPPTLQDVKALSMRDRNYLREQFDAVEGGIETSVEVECLSCSHEFERELSIDRSFFSPSALQKGSKRKSSS